MKKKVLLLVLIICSLFALSSCDDTADIPTGMQLVRGGEDVGYYLYAHSEWVVSNVGDVSRAHISSADTTSVSMVEVDIPEGVSPTDYFNNDIQKFPYEINLLANGELCSIGNIDRAYKFIFEFTYKDLKFKEMQIIATYGERSYIFSYQSSADMINEDATYFDYHYEKITQIMQNIKFVDKNISTPSVPSDPDGDGYYLASDKRLSGFELYIPVSYECEFSYGMVSAKISEKANLSLTKATGTGVSVQQYYEARKESIETFADSFTPIDVNRTKAEDGTPVTLGNLTTAASYEYTYTYNGTVYHTYQVLAVDSFNGYVFTYTAEEGEYGVHLDQIYEIIRRTVF